MKTTIERVNARKIAALFRSIGQPNRVSILLAIGKGEACVCHLESVLGERQAYISQQLMALREMGMVTSRRDGKYVFYRLTSPDLLELMEHAAKICGIEPAGLVLPVNKGECVCPSCSSQAVSIPEIQGGLDG